MSGAFVYYHYNPSLVAAAIFCTLFAISGLHHAYQLIRSRSWFMIPLLVGCVFEVIGYAARAFSAHETPNWTLGPYITQSLLLLVAPALFSASIYMILGYIILALDAEQHSPIRERWLTKIFVIGDILSFLVQGAGAGQLARADSHAQTSGKYIIVGGLILQLLFFGLFVAVSAIFNHRIRRQPLPRSMPDNGIHWRTHMHILYIVSVLIMIRSLFRLVEFLQGYAGYLLSHEVYLFIFDAALMFIVVVAFNLKHPSAVRNILTGRKAVGILKMKNVINLSDLESDKGGLPTMQGANGF